MKRILAFAVATLLFAVASSVQAADVNFNVFSQADGKAAAPASDVKVTVMTQDNDVVAESNGTEEVNFDLETGDYNVAVEQESTGFNGQQQITVGENGFSGELKLTSKGLEITDLNVPTAPTAPSTPSSLNAPSTISPVNPATSAPQLPPAPGAGAAGAAGAAAGGMGSLAMLGVVGAMIATTVAVTADEEETPVTPASRYR